MELIEKGSSVFDAHCLDELLQILCSDKARAISVRLNERCRACYSLRFLRPGSYADSLTQQSKPQPRLYEWRPLLGINLIILA